MDILLIVYSVFFSRILFRDVEALSVISPVYIYCFALIVAMFMPWYMGVIYARYKAHYNVAVSWIPFAVMILVVLVIFGIMTAFKYTRIV